MGAMDCSNCKQLARVKLLLEQTEQSARDLRASLAGVKKELVDRDRQLDVHRKMREHLAQEKAQLEMKAEQDRATIRRLEQRLAAAEAGEGLQAKAAKYRAQVLELKELHNDTEARLLLSEEARINAAREVHVLKSALGLRNELPDGALDSHGKLLHALAQSQEESSSLALALAAKEAALAEGAAALRAAQAEVERLLSLRLQLVHECEEARGEAGEALELAGLYRREAGAAKHEAGALQAQLHQHLDAQARTEGLLRGAEAALAVQQEQSQALQERLAALERAGRLSVEALQSEVSAALGAADVKVTEARAEAHARAAALGEQLAALQRQLEAAQAARALEAARHGEAQAAAEAAAARARAERDALEVQVVEARQLAARAREELDESERARQQLMGEVQRAQGEAERASREAAATAGVLGEERAEAGALRTRVEAVDAQLRSTLAASGAREEALQDQVAQLRRELSTNHLVISRLQDELASSKQQAAGAAAERAASDKNLEQLHATLESVTTSRARLQQGMLEQLNAFRDKLALVEDENRQLRLALGLVGSGTATARAIAATQGKEEQRATLPPPPPPPQRPPQQDAWDERLSSIPSTKALEQAVSAASAAAAMARISAASAGRSPGGKGAPRYVSAVAAGSLPRSLAGTPSSLLTRARLTSRALGCEDSGDDGDDTDDDLDQRASRRRLERLRIAAAAGSGSAVAGGTTSRPASALKAAPGGRASSRVPPDGSLLGAQALANVQAALRQRAGGRPHPWDD